MLLFVYGSLMRGYWNNCFLDNAKYKGVYYTVKKYTLTLEGKIPYLSRSVRRYHVRGELYDVPEKDIPDIDGHEGAPAWYYRIKLRVQGGSGDVQVAYAYFNDCEDGVICDEGDFSKYVQGDARPFPDSTKVSFSV